MIGISLGSSDDLTLNTYDPDLITLIDQIEASANKMTWFNYYFDTCYFMFDFMFDTALEIRKMLYLTNEAGQTQKTYDLSLPSCLLTVITSYDLTILADYEFGSESASAIPEIYEQGTCTSSIAAYEDIDG